MRGPVAGGVRLTPLVVGAMASQGLLVVLSPTLVAIAADLEVSVGAVGQARTVTAATAIAVSLVLTGRVDGLGVAPLLAVGGALGALGCAGVAAAPGLPAFLAAHVVVGVGFACLLSAAFAGVGAVPAERRRWAMGHVAGANALAWIALTPVVGFLTDAASWRAAQAAPAAVALAALALAGAASPVRAAATPLPLRALLATGPARRWIGAETIAYAAWSAVLTFVGAYLIQRHGARETLAGWLLALAAAAFYVAATRGGRLTARAPGPAVVAGAATAMALLVPALFGARTGLTVAVGLLVLVALAAGVRTPASGALGLAQLPGHPGAIMAARTAATQSGYLGGALAGGALIAGPGYAALGLALGACMLLSAALVLRVGGG